MGINFNNNNLGKLTTAKTNTTAKATNQNTAKAVNKNTTKAANSLNSETLTKKGQVFDSNNFGKTDVLPVKDEPAIEKGKSKDGKTKKSLGECIKEASKEMNTQQLMKDAGTSANGSAYTGAGFAMLIVGVVKWIKQ